MRQNLLRFTESVYILLLLTEKLWFCCCCCCCFAGALKTENTIHVPTNTYALRIRIRYLSNFRLDWCVCWSARVREIIFWRRNKINLDSLSLSLCVKIPCSCIILYSIPGLIVLFGDFFKFYFVLLLFSHLRNIRFGAVSQKLV